MKISPHNFLSSSIVICIRAYPRKNAIYKLMHSQSTYKVLHVEADPQSVAHTCHTFESDSHRDVYMDRVCSRVLGIVSMCVRFDVMWCERINEFNSNEVNGGITTMEWKLIMAGVQNKNATTNNSSANSRRQRFICVQCARGSLGRQLSNTTRMQRATYNTSTIYLCIRDSSHVHHRLRHHTCAELCAMRLCMHWFCVSCACSWLWYESFVGDCATAFQR